MLTSIMSNDKPTHRAPQVKGAPRLSAIDQPEGGSPPELLWQHDLVAFANQSALHSHSCYFS